MSVRAATSQLSCLRESQVAWGPYFQATLQSPNIISHASEAWPMLPSWPKNVLHPHSTLTAPSTVRSGFWSNSPDPPFWIIPSKKESLPPSLPSPPLQAGALEGKNHSLFILKTFSSLCNRCMPRWMGEQESRPLSSANLHCQLRNKVNF